MSSYKCFSCNKTISDSQVSKRVRCLYCGSKIIFKERNVVTNVKAR
ncbi:MAG: DNA-directed RNA polymerase subunit P [Nanoarchaeota archaeon]|nr:DNA-directed RNA polymerase subunit P [Nanoarchaeota archaeon]MBU1269416.1 DNA-directed RNA polymerase subunit P [Nanoarchaeota archaeon]MBU1603709.1 DNA-directed RNA polymerase subunit P [Nanoarchaeota archaeon]MBU2442946.1 DNA-directed RNA polymerase subunit P [Nanoarchaeota archaeon]